MTTHRLFLPSFRFRSLNAQIGRHWGAKAKIKRNEREVVAGYAMVYRLPRAEGKRRVSLEIVLTGHQKPTDDDNAFKSCLDALTACGLLVDDSPRWVELGTVEYSRSGEPGTTIILQDLDLQS